MFTWPVIFIPYEMSLAIWENVKILVAVILMMCELKPYHTRQVLFSRKNLSINLTITTLSRINDYMSKCRQKKNAKRYFSEKNSAFQLSPQCKPILRAIFILHLFNFQVNCPIHCPWHTKGKDKKYG